MNRSLILMVFILYCFFINVYAQERPPITSFFPQEYNAENQNWAISQCQNENIFIANNKGLLEFNGEQWELYPSPNGTIMRSVLCVDGKVYTGCHMEFGFWEYDNFGDLNYTSLSNLIKDKLIEDEEFWNILELEDWIIFQSLNSIYLYNVEDNTFNTINSDTKITKIFNVNNDIYFQRIGSGILKLEKGVEKLFINHSLTIEEEVVNIFSRNNKLLIQTREKGIYEFVNGELTEWQEPLNDLLKTFSVYNSIQLGNGDLALGTIANGLVVINNENQIRYRIDKQEGLVNSTVLSLLEDVHGNLWLGLDNGINNFNLKSPFNVYHDNNGELGSVYTSAKFNKNLYLGTNQGLFYKSLEGNEEFMFIEGTQGQVWFLGVIDNSLFCGHNSGTFIIEQNKAKKISNTQGTWAIGNIPSEENLLLQGNYNGLSILEKNGNEWFFRNNVEGFSNSAKSLEFINTNTLFINHEYKGIYKVELDEEYKSVKSISIDSIYKGLYSHLVKYNNDIFYSYEEGIFRLNESENTFAIDTILSNANRPNQYLSGKMINDNLNNRLWFFNSNALWYTEPGKLDSKQSVNSILLSKEMRNTVTGYENILHLEKNNYLIGTASGYITLDLDKIENKSYNIKINHVINSDTHEESDSTQLVDLEDVGDFSNKNNNLKFTYNITDYEKYNVVKYQYKLEGIYNKWSDWSYDTEETFENLPFGDYTFKVRGSVNNQLSSNVATYSFTIARPWYLSNAMLAVYILSVLLFSLMMHNIYKRYYTKQRNRLIERNKKEIELKELENQRQLMRFKNEQLEKDIESKNRELAISTMSLIKKNEFLSSIKKELLKEKDKNVQGVKSVVKTIDNNLNNSNDWKLFEEAFNNADKDFLKKVKSIHSGLTPNDLRLCAYLRLNLSSKEIAPLLNISPRSVEVKRYRLRKKDQFAA